MPEKTMAYVDGFLLAVKTKNLKNYAKMSKAAGKIWRSHGALDYKECAGDDLNIKGLNSFSKLIKCGKGETAIFAFIVYKSRAHRDKVNAKVMKDPRMGATMQGMEMPFDMKRMWMGGFKVFVDA
jgi:uncharacterized protein YbaA (DUF1428 family)